MDVGTHQYTNLIKEIGIGVLFIKEQKDNLNVIRLLPQKWLLTKYNTYYNGYK
jgi:dihydropteroate synthase